MNPHSKLPIYKLAYDLLSLAASVTKDMPRDFKQTLGKKIAEECIEMMLLISRANAALANSNDRVMHITRLLERLEVAALMIRLGHDHRYISNKLFAQAIQLTENIGRQAGGWRKSSNPAAAPAA